MRCICQLKHFFLMYVSISCIRWIGVISNNFRFLFWATFIQEFKNFYGILWLKVHFLLILLFLVMQSLIKKNKFYNLNFLCWDVLWETYEDFDDIFKKINELKLLKSPFTFLPIFFYVYVCLCITYIRGVPLRFQNAIKLLGWRIGFAPRENLTINQLSCGEFLYCNVICRKYPEHTLYLCIKCYGRLYINQRSCHKMASFNSIYNSMISHLTGYLCDYLNYLSVCHCIQRDFLTVLLLMFSHLFFCYCVGFSLFIRHLHSRNICV